MAAKSSVSLSDAPAFPIEAVVAIVVIVGVVLIIAVNQRRKARKLRQEQTHSNAYRGGGPDWKEQIRQSGSVGNHGPWYE